MAHIAIDARIINSSTGRYVERLLYYLQQIPDDNQYTILVRKKDVNFWKPEDGRFTILVAEFDNYSFAEQIGFKKFLDKLAPDLVHFCMPQQPIRYEGRKVTTVHDLTLLKTYNSDKNKLVYKFKQKVGRYVFQKVADTNFMIMTPSEYTRQDFINLTGILPDRVVVTYEAADPPVEARAPSRNVRPYNNYLMYVGQQSDYKNIARLGEAHQKVIQKYPGLGLLLVGRDNAATQKNKEYFGNRDFKNIHFTGFVDDNQLAWLYRNADAYVFPSLMEGFGLPGIEAMQYDTPLISSDATCLPEIYGNAAHYFNPTEPDDIARAILDVLDNPNLRNQLIANGQVRRDQFSWQRMAEQTHNVYLKALQDY